MKQVNLLKIVAMGLLVATLSSCSSKSKTADGSGISNETTANGESARLDNSVNFAPTGSDTGTIEGLYSLNFGYDSTSLSESEKSKLDKNVEWLTKNTTSGMIVEGHCDQRGSTEYNLSLGERRANAVKKMLLDAGISASRIKTASYGKEKPLTSGDSEEAMAQNRRANFVPTSK